MMPTLAPTSHSYLTLRQEYLACRRFERSLIVHPPAYIAWRLYMHVLAWYWRTPAAHHSYPTNPNAES